MSPINFSPDLKARATQAYNPEASAPVRQPVAPARVTFGKRKASK